MIDDGIWCPDCRKFHPTIMWHRKYNEKDSQICFREKIKRKSGERPKLFGILDHMSEAEKNRILEEVIAANLENKPIADAEIGECVICGSPTAFISKQTGRHICSDECLHKENGWKEDATGQVLVFD